LKEDKLVLHSNALSTFTAIKKISTSITTKLISLEVQLTSQ